MKTRTKMKVAAAIAAVSLMIVAKMGIGIYSADAELKRNLNYQKASEFYDMKSKLGSAEDELTYSGSYITFQKIGKITTPVEHPAQYPDAKDAKESISNVMAQLKNKRVRNQKCLIERLDSVSKSLPDKNDIHEYKDQSVNYNTFKPQRTQLDTVEEELNAARDKYMENVPDDLKAQKRNSVIGLILSVVGLLTSMAVLFRRHFFGDDYEDEDD